MSYLCNKNSFLKEHKSKVKSCQPASLTVNGQKLTGYDVELEETIFFPEGGGQPYDLGCLGDEEVVHVRREVDRAILFVRSRDEANDEVPFTVGDEPLQLIDWQRRFDHMQQHSAQHLISALAGTLFAMNTTSWTLGPQLSYIEFDVPEVSASTLESLEKACNEAILEALPVTASYFTAEQLGSFRKRMEIPNDNTGLIRILTIGSQPKPIDENPCCGTHVSNLSQLQMIKLLYAQKGKKGKSLIYFVAGERLRAYTNKIVTRERALTDFHKCLPEELPSLIEKSLKNAKRLHKNCLALSRDLAQFEANKYLQLGEEKPKLYSVHRKEGEFDFIIIFMNAIASDIGTGRLVIVSVADDSLVNNSGGQFMIAGDEQLVEKASQLIISKFEAKGSLAKNKTFRGRIGDVSKFSKIDESILKELF